KYATAAGVEGGCILNKKYLNIFQLIMYYMVISRVISISFSFIDIINMDPRFLILWAEVAMEFFIFVPLILFLHYENPTQSVYSRAKDKVKAIGKSAIGALDIPPRLTPVPVRH
ncbi:MAG: hypothetical protein ACWGQW_06870, partial [bacterium]